MRPISYALSPTWAIKLMRMSIAGINNPAQYFTTFGILVGITAIYVLFSSLLYQVIDRQVRIKATLEVS